MRIGELAARTSVSVRSLRYYEQQGLLASERSESGQRLYPNEAVARVTLIQQLFTAGISSSTMAELLPCITDPAERTSLLGERLLLERERIDRSIRDLTNTKEALDRVIAEMNEPTARPRER